MLSGGNRQELVPLWSLAAVTRVRAAHTAVPRRESHTCLLSSFHAACAARTRALDLVASGPGQIPYASIGTLPDGKTSFCPDLQTARFCYHRPLCCGDPEKDPAVSCCGPAKKPGNVNVVLSLARRWVDHTAEMPAPLGGQARTRSD